MSHPAYIRHVLPSRNAAPHAPQSKWGLPMPCYVYDAAGRLVRSLAPRHEHAAWMARGCILSDTPPTEEQEFEYYEAVQRRAERIHRLLWARRPNDGEEAIGRNGYTAEEDRDEWKERER